MWIWLALFLIPQDDLQRQVEALAAKFGQDNPADRDQAMKEIQELAYKDFAAVRKTLLACKDSAKDPEIRARIETTLQHLPALSITLELQEKKLRAGDKVAATIRIKNNSDEDMTLVGGPHEKERLCTRYPAFRLVFFKKDKEQGTAQAPIPPAGMFEWGTEELLRVQDLIVLKAGESLTVASTWGEARFFRLPELKPGKYTAQLVLDFTVKLRMRDDQEQGKLDRLPKTAFYSKKIEIQVVD